MPNTHCLPSGSLGSGELAVPAVATTNSQVLIPASGLKRGVVVFAHGLGIVGMNIPNNLTGAPLTFIQGLQTDGWVVVNAPYAEDVRGPLGTTALFNDVSVDAGHGSRYLTQALHWWDHLVAYVHATFGNWPMMIFGVSWGGWHAIKVAKARLSQIGAYLCHVPVTVLSQIPASFTAPNDFTAINTTGLDVASTDLNSATVPGMIGWGTNDTVVGSANPSALFTAASNAGRPVTSNATTDTHTWTTTDTTTYQTWVTNTVDPLFPKTF